MRMKWTGNVVSNYVISPCADRWLGDWSCDHSETYRTWNHCIVQQTHLRKRRTDSQRKRPGWRLPELPLVLRWEAGLAATRATSGSKMRSGQECECSMISMIGSASCHTWELLRASILSSHHRKNSFIFPSFCVPMRWWMFTKLTVVITAWYVLLKLCCIP